MQYTGSVSYKDIKDRQYITMDNIDNNKITEVISALDNGKAKYSAMYDDTSITVTFEKSDAEMIRKIIDPVQPVQSAENLDNTKSDIALEELRRQILQMQENQQRLIEQLEEERAASEKQTRSENTPQNQEEEFDSTELSEYKPEHACLLPVISSKVLKQEQKLDTLYDRKSVQESKVSDYQSRIDKLSGKADKLTAVNQMLTELMNRGKIPAAVTNSVKAIIRSNEVKIARICNEKIPKLQNKIDSRKKKIDLIDKRIDLAQNKINRYNSLNDVIKSFFHADKDRFSSALDELHNNSVSLLNAKIDVCHSKIITLTKTYKDNPIAAASIGIPMTLRKLRQREMNLIRRKNKLIGVSVPYADQTDKVKTNVFAKAEEAVNNAVKQDNIEPAVVADSVVDESVSVIPQHVIVTPSPSTDYPLLLPEIATIMDTSVSELESKPNDVKELMVNSYINSVEATPDTIRENLSAVITPDVRVEEKLTDKRNEKELEANQKQVKENPLKNAEELLEVNGNMIDGIINNEPPKKEEPKKEPPKKEIPKHEPPKQRFSFSLSQLKRNAKTVSEQKQPSERQNNRKPPDHGEL